MAHTPYGYVIKDGIAILDACQANQVRALFRDYVAGGSLSQIARKNQVHRSHVTIGRMLEDPRYLGDNYYPAIVDENLWKEAQIERRKRAEALGRGNGVWTEDRSNLLSFEGLIFCDACGSEFRSCSHRDQCNLWCKRYIVNKRVTCKSPKITEDELRSAFLEMISDIDLDEVSRKPKQVPILIEQKFSDPFKQAEYAYSICQIDDFDYMTAKLISALADRPKFIGAGFMRRIVQCITIAQDGSMQFTLINRKIIRRETKSNGSPASIHHSGDT